MKKFLNTFLMISRALIILLAPGIIVVGQNVPSMPMPVDESRSAQTRWLNKKVLRSVVLDDMESTNNWVHLGAGEVSFTRERAIDGKQSARLISTTKPEKPNTKSGRPFGEAVLRRVVNNEDWTQYNRISVWVYPHLPGFNVISLLVKLNNNGSVKVPDQYNREGLNYVLLKPDRWNQVVFEIAHLSRDRVSAIDFVYRMQGNEPGATNVVCFDFDKLELQVVEPDHFEGWDVAKGRIAYSHSGYPAQGQKIAFTSDGSAKRFSVVNESRKVVLTKPVRTVGFGDSAIPASADPQKGSVKFQLMDFSELTKPGIYRIEYGDLKTAWFRIGDGVWLDSIWKTINFFYCERCGYAVHGIHGVCHSDWQAMRGDKTIVINGGWHDAGDLSQGLVNTSESVWSMFALAERLMENENTNNINSALARRVVEEAVWGLKWILKTRFPDGSRVTWATMDYWTDCVIGTADDTFGGVGESPFDIFLACSAEAIASRILRSVDAGLAQQSLSNAVADWRTALKRAQTPNLSVASAGALAGVELYKTTKEKNYLEKAIEFADVIIASQQREYTDWDIPLVGFFYTIPQKQAILHYSHRGHEQAPIVPLAELCKLLPQHTYWMKWYSTVVLHSEYLKRISKFTYPYLMLPASPYSIEESQDPRFKEQLKNGIRLSEKYYLRRFPVWFEFRGNSGTILSQAKAISTAGLLRRDEELIELAQRQLQWHLGMNPFCQSLMYGEGYDYAPQYTAMSGDMVGSLPVGIQTRENFDRPYWQPANCYNYKEVWVHPSGRWLAIMADIFGWQTQITLLKGKLDYEVSAVPTSSESVSITVIARGEGMHNFKIRTINLAVDNPEQTITLVNRIPKKIVWNAKVVSPKEPWVAVVIPDDNFDGRKEVIKRPFLK